MRLVALACLLLGFGGAFAADTPPSIETFFRLPQYSAMKISPDGKHIAALAPFKGRQNLVVMTLEPRTVKPVTGLDALDIVWFTWLGPNRLLMRTGSRGTMDFEARGGALWALDRDGTAARELSEGSESAALRAVVRPLIPVRDLPGDSEEFIAQEIVIDTQRAVSGGLFRVDSRSGRRTAIGLGKPDIGENESWVVDNRGVARVFTATAKGNSKVYYRAGSDAPWEKLDEMTTVSPGWYPLAVAQDDKTLYVSSQKDRDKAAIRRYDPATKTFGDVLAEHPQVDLRDLVWDYGKVVGTTYDADRAGSAMFDAGLARIQKDVDAAMPQTVNTLSWSRDRSRVLIDSRSDVSPGAFYLMDAKAGKVEWLSDRAPWINPKEMAPMKPVRYTARDGLEIPAYLTTPRGKPARGLPLVVVVHGGPWVDGYSWEFDPETQFLASRGYAVLQPNFRGTTRYGWKHFRSSFGQWGLAMQDDITDAVKWAVGEGIADPRRICIYGASYGGYAAMMGVATTPELYRCAINYVGVTDLRLFFAATWADYSYSDAIRYAVRDMVGDPERDAERLRKTSPTELASRIKSPVLMAYGAEDRRVPIEHGTRMRAALDRAGVKYEWMVMDGEGHGFRDLQNQKAFYGAMEKFLAEHLKH
jgi:dipeptidyl aminopeptidase/acylaminoacyl peptidase